MGRKISAACVREGDRVRIGGNIEIVRRVQRHDEIRLGSCYHESHSCCTRFTGRRKLDEKYKHWAGAQSTVSSKSLLDRLQRTS